MYRIGFSKDIHKLVAKRKLMLAGLCVPYIKGELAYSDGDVVLHALSEAMLGALALGDLGKFYPNSDKKYKNIESKFILLDVYKKVKKMKYKIVNIDISIELEAPKLAGYITKMKNNLAKLLKININQISIKAGTNEGLGETGRNEAVIAYCVVLLNK